MKYIQYPDKSTWKQLVQRPVFDFSEIEARVAPVLKEVKEKGDKAISKFTSQFDKIQLDEFKVSAEEIAGAGEQLSVALRDALKLAKQNIETFHSRQKDEISIVETMPGVKCWRKSVGIEKVGLYIPGGTAPLCSTVLMLGVPAQLAGCREIIMCTPASKEGKVHPAVLYAAQLCGINQIYKIGGAQAIAAMAYGTETVPQVYKIFGPGNQYVTAAKQLVNKEGVAIDMPAGPSEVLVFADQTANPAFVASDLLSQAEHGTDSQAILVTTDPGMNDKVQMALYAQLDMLPRKDIAAQSIRNSKSILVNNNEEAIELINDYAPEHLILAMDDYDEIAQGVINAGSVFLGHYTPESAGDYASGTNHTLPTNGYAKAYSGVSLDSFVKKITFQQITKAGIQNLGPTIELMAEAEELQAHKNAVTLRIR